MKKQTIIALAAIAATATLVAAPVAAYEAGEWAFKAGMTNIDPEQTNGKLSGGIADGAEVVIDDDTSLSLLGVWHFTPALGLELLASLPFEHDFTVGGGVGGSTQHLPPTLSLQYYFNTNGTIVPYIGLGVNYTKFFSTETYGALEGVKIDLDDSVGGAVQAGIDYIVSEKWFVNLDVRYIQIESDIKVNGVNSGKVKVNPTTVGVNVGYRF